MTTLRRYLAERLAAAVVTLLGVSLIVFLMVRVLPGDPARVIAGVLASEEEVGRLRSQLELDRSLPVQYGSFLLRLARGNLGVSARTSEPVTREVLGRLPRTVELAVVSSAIATAIGIAAGVAAAACPYSIVDYLLSVVTLSGVSMPVYWLGLVLIIVFAIDLNWLPAAGAEEPASIVLPALTLGAFSMALIARMTRSSVLEVLGQDYVRTARAKGLAERAVLWRHALGNALVPIITAVGLQFGALLGGAVLTESVFGWPGLGLLLIDSIFARDYPVVQGIVLTFSALFTLTNLLVDLLYAYVDPRIHYG
ncbi:MAG: peptide ABC transporter permease [Candidatus Rokuibacteriota bacterium]|nr:MAG: peptide ABC transporter permease [Candidatus Rokubacteria bacterium]